MSTATTPPVDGPHQVARPPVRKEPLGDVLRRRSNERAEESTKRADDVQLSLDALTRTAPATLLDVPLDDLHPNPFQPRFQFQRLPLEELAQSLASEGQLEPVIARRVRRDGHPLLEIVAGARRLEAAKICNASIRPLPTLRVDVRDLTDDEAERISLVENLQRENLTPLEEGYRYWQLQQRDPRTWSVRAIAEYVHKKKSTVQNRIGLIRDPSVAEAVLREQLSPTAGSQLLRLPEPERGAYLQIAITQRLTIDQIKTDIDRRHGQRGAAPNHAASPSLPTEDSSEEEEGGRPTVPGDGQRPYTYVHGHVRSVRHPGSAAERTERRSALQAERSAVQARIESLEGELRDQLASLRQIDRELHTLDR